MYEVNLLEQDHHDGAALMSHRRHLRHCGGGSGQLGQRYGATHDAQGDGSPRLW